MGALIDSVGEIMSRAERRVEISAQNISNITTPGYKRVVNFESELAPKGNFDPTEISNASPPSATTLAIDFTPGKRVDTGSNNDLAILGDGFFVVQGNEGSLYTRAGRFQRDADGQLVTTQGFPLQSESGGDITLKEGPFLVQSDGTVMQAGEAVGRIAVVDFTDRSLATPIEGGLFSTPDSNVRKIDSASIDQGSLEASNVSAGTEMIAIMAAMRNAQAGAKLANLYDDLMARAITAFGQE
jgi:flagellar basal-body rod protein FlgF